jgi:hypothetical protein
MRVALTAAALAVLVAAGGYTGTRSVTRSIEDPHRMVEAVLGQVPVGTPVDEAERFMEHEG